MTRFALTFIALLLGLFTLEMTVPAQQHVIMPFTNGLAKLSAALILPFDSSVVSSGNVLRFTDTGFGVAIEAGCNGVEATIVLIAAIIAFPGRWSTRLAAIALGFLTIQLLNLARIISLFYLGNWDMQIFSWVHLYLWPALIMLDVLFVFLVYLHYLERKGKHDDQPGNGDGINVPAHG